jgi:hypothetical protein
VHDSDERPYGPVRAGPVYFGGTINAADQGTEIGPTVETDPVTAPTITLPTSILGRGYRCQQVPTCTDRGCRGRWLRGAVPPVPRGFVGTKFAVQGYSEELVELAGVKCFNNFE